MSTRKAILLVALAPVAVVLLWFGGPPAPPRAVTQRPAPVLVPMPTLEPPKPPGPADVPVVYDTRLWAEPMTDAMKREIIKLAAPLTPKGQRIWYIHSHVNDVSEGHWRCRTIVYFTPHESTPRLRRGQRVVIVPGMLPGGFRKVPREELDELLRNASDEDRRYYEQKIKSMIDNPLTQWSQVSLADDTFGETLTPPQKPQVWPFANPHAFTDEEIVAIVDFIRTGPDSSSVTENPDGSFTVSGSGRADPSEPILSIVRSDDGTVNVWTGTVQGPLAGSGQTITLRRVGDTFKVIEISQWVS